MTNWDVGLTIVDNGTIVQIGPQTVQAANLEQVVYGLDGICKHFGLSAYARVNKSNKHNIRSISKQDHLTN